MIALAPKPGGIPRINWQHPLADHLYAAYFFTEQGGLRANDATGRQVGTLKNTPKFVHTPYGSGVSFGGLSSGDYVTGNLTVNNWPRITVITRCYFNTLTTTRRFVCDTGIASFVLGTGIDSHDTLRMRIRTGVTTDATSLFSVAPLLWATYFGSYDGATVWVGKNGVPLGSASVTGSLNTGTDLNIGGNAAVVGDTIDGIIDYVLVYNAFIGIPKIVEITNDPYALIRPARRTVVKGPAASSTTLEWAGCYPDARRRFGPAVMYDAMS